MTWQPAATELRQRYARNLVKIDIVGRAQTKDRAGT